MTVIDTSAVGPASFVLEDDGPINGEGHIRSTTGGYFQEFGYPSMLTFLSGAGQAFTVNLFEYMGALTLGSLTDPSVNPDTIRVRKVVSASTVTMAADLNILESGNDAEADIFGSHLALWAGTGIGSAANALETQVGTLEAKTATGGIAIRNFGNLTVGGMTQDTAGLSVATSGNIALDVLTGGIDLADTNGVASIVGGSSSGHVTLSTPTRIVSIADHYAVWAPRGNITVSAGNVQLGLGTNFDNDMHASGSITIGAEDFVTIDGLTNIASDSFGLNTGGGVSISADIIDLADTHGNGASIAALGTAGADVTLSAHTVLISAPRADAVHSSSGDVTVNADTLVLAGDSGIRAASGIVTLRPLTDGRQINICTVSDAVPALSLSAQELNRVFARDLVIGGAQAGSIFVFDDFAPANVTNVTLESGSDVLVYGENIVIGGDLVLRAGDNIIMGVNTDILADSITGYVDADNADPGVGGVAYVDPYNFTERLHFNGNADNDTLSGGLASDTLDGGAGADRLTGHKGDDVYIVDNAGDLTIETADEGIDAVFSSVTRALSANIEYLTLTGTGNIDGTGNTLGNFLYGNGGDNVLGGGAGNDVLFGEAGNDSLLGGTGNDVLYGGDGNDILDGQGNTDTVRYKTAAAGVTVAINAGPQITGGAGTDTLIGIENLDGSNFNDALTGDGLKNVLSGLAGADKLDGGAGDDTLYGGEGDDTLIGGTGRDRLSGSAGNDTFKFGALAESGTAATTRDLILDFLQGDDTIDLSIIDASTLAGGDQAFDFIGSAGFSGIAGQLRAVQAGAATLISADVDGDKVADFQIQLQGLHAVTAGDFAL